ncbi:putative Type IV pili biogenesis protein PilQ [Nitrospira sp. KM1]|uniref:type IV pilus secretin family protein n=1 Tax=Nitrospira sp. KM1 TaxID=1936990 RepID=UPI0013A73D4B|nr:type IV pilus secretin family protein [Nitrospira sp. KM1]BCA56765.1 putative Type IV pili biogenesis protein PilQ [Nitrospira sp. KM1]
MIPKAMQTTTLVRVVSAIGVFGMPLTIPMIGGTAEIPDYGQTLSDISVPSVSADMAMEDLAHTVTDVDIRRGDDDVKVVISGDGRLRHEVNLLGEKRLVVDIPGVSAAVRKPVYSVDHQLLKKVRLGYHADKVRVVFDLGSKSTFSVEPQDTTIAVTLKKEEVPQVTASGESHVQKIALASEGEDRAQGFPGSIRSLQKPSRSIRRIPASFQIRPVQMMTDPTVSENNSQKDDLVLGETRYVGRRISLDFQQADISNVLRLIAEVSGFNIVVGEGVKSKVTMKLVSVPWDQALDMILKMNGLGKIRQGNILWIDSLSNIAKQEDEEARAKDAKTKAEALVDRVFYVRNLQAQELMTSLRQNLSPRGVMQVSVGTNALIVRDTESKMIVLKQLIDGLDLAVPQVQIEARIVQADTTYSRSLGVQWGVQNVNTLGPSFGVANFKSGTTGTFGNQTSDFLVNLPATVGGLVSTPGAGFTFGKADGAMLDVRLSAGELLGLSKVIAAPKVTTLDKREAKISQGESIPFQTTSLQGTQTTFVDANLELNVTPQITSRDPKEVGKQILMRVRATRNAVGARSNPAGPSIDRREANTQVIIRDGETMVIGGVFIDTQNNNVAGVPYLSRIPVLGWLFKNKTESVSKQELLIFMTPTIVKVS